MWLLHPAGNIKEITSKQVIYNRSLALIIQTDPSDMGSKHYMQIQSYSVSYSRKFAFLFRFEGKERVYVPGGRRETIPLYCPEITYTALI